MAKNLPNALKDKRLSLKLKVKDLAEILDTTSYNIYKWEGETVPSDSDVSKKIVKFIEGFYDSCIQNGLVNFRILHELKLQLDESSVKSDATKVSLNQPPLNINLDFATSTIIAQNRTIELLEKEIQRLQRENELLREQVDKKN